MRQFVWHEGESFLHRLNPLTKLGLSVPVAVVAVVHEEPVTPLLVALVASATTWRLGRVPARSVLAPLLVSLVAGFGMFWSGLVFYAGPGAGATPMLAGPVRITEAGLVYALTMIARLLAIVSASSLFVLTTNPVDFVIALIQQARLPARVGYAVFAAYRFVPLIQEELENIRAAHQVRGGSDQGLVARLRQTFGYAIPLLAISVRRAERVALAMDARGFGARPDRTYFRTTTVTLADLWFGIGAAITLSAIVWVPRALGL